MTSKLVVNTIEADTGISSVSFASSISMNSSAKFHFSAAGIDIGADTNINRPAAGVLGFNISGAEKLRIDTNGHLNTSGIATASNFKTGSSNLHSTGLTVGNNFLHTTGINVGTGATIHVPSSNVLTLGTNSSERLRITSTGRMGLGKSSPSQLLHLKETGSNSTYIALEATDANNNVGILMGDPDDIDACYMLYNNQNNYLAFATNANERLRIASDGKTTYNTTGQVAAEFNTSHSSAAYHDYKLGASGARIGYIGAGSQLVTSSGNTDFAIRTENNFVIGTNGNNERLRIDSNGMIGIGGVTPKTQNTFDAIEFGKTGFLGSQTAARTVEMVSNAYYNSGWKYKEADVATQYYQYAGYHAFGTAASGSADGAISFLERLRIDSSGRVVIGGTSSYIGGAALAVLGTGTTPNSYGSFAIGKVGANPTAGTTLANIRLNGGSIATRRGAEINAIANSNWTDGSSHPTKLTFAVANVNTASVTERYQINHYGHHIFTNENVMPSSGSAGTNSFKGLSQHGYQHWGQRQYYSGQRNMAQNDTFDLFSNNVAHDDIIFWLNIKGYHANRTFATAHGTIGGYGLSVTFQSATGVYGSFSASNIGSGRNALRWTSTSPHGANWWIWGWFSGTSSTGTHTGWAAAQNF